MKILIADDDPILRTLLEHELTGQGHSVVAVEDGWHAWEAILQEPFEILITDWIMPEIDGLDLCRLVRSMDAGLYIYTILISSRSENENVLAAFDAGADDFISKPIHFPILHARIRAGERIIRLEHELARRSETLLEMNLELHEARASMHRDLEAGAELQHTLLPPPLFTSGDYTASWLYRPHSIVAGDMLNVFARDAETLVFYLFDVVGHGIRSALLTVSVTKMLTSPMDARPLLDDRMTVAQPAQCVLQSLNDRFQSVDTSQYFTMVYGTISRLTGRINLGQAGHPPPILVQRDGSTRLIGEGGLPIGWVPDIEFETYDLELPPGGRLILYSDGASECENAAGDMFTPERIARHFADTRALPITESLARLEAILESWTPGARYTDDVSLLVIERAVSPEAEIPTASKRING
ncbi:MAG: SpoIIE family protein phosphatase [Rhodothermales bacterium]|nr:SpoIIE family protein phosphatase [Rhodothermales bacterium]